MWIFINVFSSVGLVLLNKWIFTVEGFSFGGILTLIHFIITAIGLEICALIRVFEKKYLPLCSILPLSITFTGFVVLTNLSLKYNSVGFYQLAKVMTTPCIILIQMLFYAMTFPLKIHMSLVIILVGVIIVSVTDVQLNFLGAFIAFAGVIITSLYQIWVNTTTTELQVNSMQLLYHQARLSCIFLIICFPAIDDMNLLIEFIHQINFSQICWILISAILAFFVNISTYFIIGNTSPVTYNVVGHFKTCVVLAGGFIIFNYPIILRNIGGIVLTLFGVFLYTYFKLGKT